MVTIGLTNNHLNGWHSHREKIGGKISPARYSDMHCSNCSQTLLQRFDDAVVTFIRHFSCLMKVITASSKHCNNVCEQFEQCMSEYRAGYNYHCYYDPQVVQKSLQFEAGAMQPPQEKVLGYTLCFIS